jgi:glutathione S-transferase
MLRLYDYLPSQNGYKIRMLLGHLGLAWETVAVAIFRGESRTPEFLKKNPAGAIPVLEPAPGRFIAESNAILCYLAEGTRFLPADRLARAQVMQWLFFEQYYIEPTLGTLRFWTLTGRLRVNAGLVPGKRAGAERALQALERHLAGRPFSSPIPIPSPISRSSLTPISAKTQDSTSPITPRSAPGSRASRKRRAHRRRCILIRSIRTPILRAGES